MLIMLAASVVMIVATLWAMRWIAHSHYPRYLRLAGLTGGAAAVLGAFALAGYIGFYIAAPAPQVWRDFAHDGIDLRQQIWPGNGRAVMHVAKIDLAKLDVTITTPPDVDPDRHYRARTTSDALARAGGLLAVNGSFFMPFKDRHLFDYYPHDGGWVQAIGETFVDGMEFGWREEDGPALAITPAGAVIGAIDSAAMAAAREVRTAMLSGMSLLVRGGVNVARPGADPNPYPRTAVGVDAAGRQLWLVVVDGKQPFYSNGLRLRDLAEVMIELGAHAALELDGGGSTAMAARVGETIRLINRPSHTNLPGRERPVANHIIVREKSVSTR